MKQIAQELDVDVLELLSESRHIYLISDNSNHSGNIIGSSTEIAFEIQKLQMQLSHKDETIEFQKREIARLEEIIELMKK